MKPLKESRSCAEPSKRVINILRAAMIVVALFFSVSSAAQPFSSAVGVRASVGGIVSYKHSLNAEIMAEGIMSLRWKGVIVTALLERYSPAFANPNAWWYYGGGLHLGFSGRQNSFDPAVGANTTTYINLGMDLVGGLEYRFDKLPLSVSADYIPAFYFTGDRWFVGEGVGLSVRYILR